MATTTLLDNNAVTGGPHAQSFCLAHIRTRIDRGESMGTIGRELGVSKQSVRQWLTGERRPSRTVLVLASLLYRAPVDLAPGLPVGLGDAGG